MKLNHLTTICVTVRDRVVCLSVCVLSPPEPLEIWKHEWYHVVTNCQGHVLSPSGLLKVAKNRQKSQNLTGILQLSGATTWWQQRAGRRWAASTISIIFVFNVKVLGGFLMAGI